MTPVFLIIVFTVFLFLSRKKWARLFPYLHGIGVLIACGVPVLMSLPAVFRFPHPLPALTFYVCFLFLYPSTFFFPRRFEKVKAAVSLYFHFLIFVYWVYPLRAMLTISPALTVFFAAAGILLQFVLFANVPGLKFRIFTALAFFALFSGLRVASFVSTTEHHCNKIIDNAAVTPLLTYCTPDWHKTMRKLEPRFNPHSCQFRGARFAIPSHDSQFVYMGTGGCDKQDIVMKYSRKTQRIVKNIIVENSYSLFETLHPHRLFVSAHPSKLLYILDPVSFKIIKTLKTPGAPMHVSGDESTGRLFLNYEHDPVKLQVLRLKNYREIKKERVIDISTQYMAYDAGRKILYFVGRDGWKDYLTAIDAENYEQISIAIPSFAVGIALNTRDAYVFAALPMKGLIGVYDAKTLAPVKFLKAGFGVRELAFDNQKQVLYAGNYITGKIKVFDVKRGKMLKEFFAGMRIRRMAYLEPLKKLFVANANGFLEMDPDKL